MLMFRELDINSIKVLNKYFYYNPTECVWISRLTNTTASEYAVHEIEQLLNTPSEGTGYKGGIRPSEQQNPSVFMLLMPTLQRLQALGPQQGFDEQRWNKCIHWLAVCITEMEGPISDSMQRLGPLPGSKSGDWETFKRYAEAVMDDGCHHPVSGRRNRLSTLETTTSHPPHPLENHGERMIVHPILAKPVTRKQAVEYDETDTDTSISSTCRDKKSDCSIEPDSEDDKTDANASIALSEEENEQRCPKSDPKDVDIDTSANSTCRDEESDCSVEEDPESDETDAKASVDLNKEDNGHCCLEIHSEGQMNAFVVEKESPTMEGSRRGGETSAETGDTSADSDEDVTDDEDSDEDSDKDVTDDEDSDDNATDDDDSDDNATEDDEVNAAPFTGSEIGEGKLEAPTDERDVDEADSDDDITDKVDSDDDNTTDDDTANAATFKAQKWVRVN